MRTRRFIGFSLLPFLLDAQPVSTASSTTPPIVIDRVETTQVQGGDSVLFTFRNASSKGIVAYVMYVNAYAGPRLVEGVMQQFVTSIPSERKLKPGQTWQATASLIRSNETSPTPTDRAEAIIDWILFDDMTSSGPDQSTLGGRSRSEIEGARQERARLKEILKLQGAQGLIDSLNRDDGFPKRVKKSAAPN